MGKSTIILSIIISLISLPCFSSEPIPACEDPAYLELQKKGKTMNDASTDNYRDIYLNFIQDSGITPDHKLTETVMQIQEQAK